MSKKLINQHEELKEQNIRKPLYPWAPEIYNNMMNPISLEPIKERAWNHFLWNLGLTITWPITAPGSFIWAMQRNLRGKGHFSDGYIVLGCLTAPYILATESKSFLTKRTVALKFSNIDELLEEETILTKPDGINPGIRFSTRDRGKDSPYRFGDSSSNTDRYGFLDLIFPDNLALDDFSAMYYATANRENPGNLYLDCEYFLKVNPDDTRRLYEEFEKVRKPGANDLRK
ncbi:hypothetical protein HOE04_01535 [archaeon]|jgi:hypothetical protein|nr:hypothetical protein [archaeon]